MRLSEGSVIRDPFEVVGAQHYIGKNTLLGLEQSPKN
jgi:hypothetical protein